MTYSLPEDRLEILKRVGQMSQIAGTKRYVLADGRGAGVECVDVRTGSGFEYTVMPGRGMDIGWCGYQGMPISYISKAGITNPAYFTGVKDQWLQCFPGGMLSTCGLGNAGNYVSDETRGLGVQDFGLHGRISSQCASQVNVKERWDGNAFVMEVSGTDTEAQLRGEALTLERSVSSSLGENCLHLRDVITNEDFIERPYMVMYHINFGYPLVDEGSQILIRNNGWFTDVPCSQERADSRYEITGPTAGIDEDLYFHNSPKDGNGVAAVINRKIGALGYVRYSAASLPFLTEWKMMGASDYVVGLEAGNCIPRGRKYARENGMLQTLKPHEHIVNELEIGIITGASGIEQFLKENR